MLEALSVMMRVNQSLLQASAGYQCQQSGNRSSVTDCQQTMHLQLGWCCCQVDVLCCYSSVVLDWKLSLVCSAEVDHELAWYPSASRWIVLHDTQIRYPTVPVFSSPSDVSDCVCVCVYRSHQQAPSCTMLLPQPGNCCRQPAM